MATGTFYLRPSADISIDSTFTLYPSESANAYLLINEEVADDATTYLISHADDTEDYTASAKFALSGNIPTSKIKVTSVTLFGRCLAGGEATSTFKYSIAVGDTVIATVSSQGVVATWRDATVTTDDATVLSILNNYIEENGIGSFAEITLTVEHTMAKEDAAEGSKSAGVNARTTQVYVAVNYTEITGLNIHRKVSGAWVQAQSAYQKQNGSWVEITEDECKEILQGSLCTSG